VDFRARGTKIIGKDEEQEDSLSRLYRDRINSSGSPSQTVAAGYQWRPGTELAEETPDITNLLKNVA